MKIANRAVPVDFCLIAFGGLVAVLSIAAAAAKEAQPDKKRC